jgi:y4mF family transcriptional regulator
MIVKLKDFVKNQRKIHGFTQMELARKAGVGLRFVRDLEQGKATLRMDRVNQVLQLFGKILGPIDWRPDIDDRK